MKKSRKNYKGQSVIEYAVIFAIVVALAIAMIPRIIGTPGNPGIFNSYVTTATGAMQ